MIKNRISPAAVGTHIRKKKTYRQYGALPYMLRDGQLTVLLVTSRDTGRWVIPKGWPKRGMKGSHVAAAEAYEEAGVTGDVVAKPCATFDYTKRISDTKSKLCRVAVFLLAVHQVLDDWPEKDQRKREWLTPNQAAERVSDLGLIDLLLELGVDEAARSLRKKDSFS